MTREEQLKSCSVCTHRQMDMHKGLLCGLTQNAANFEGVCPNFEQDEKEFQKLQQIQQEVMNYWWLVGIFSLDRNRIRCLDERSDCLFII